MTAPPPARFAVALLATLVALSQTGCPRDEPPPRRGPVLNLWHTFNPQETRTLNGIVRRLQRRHGWRVQPTVIPFARAQNKFRRAAQRCGAGAPDVFRAELPWVAEFVSKGLIRPVPDKAPSPAGYLAQARAASVYRGKRWVLPASVDCLALLYNRTYVAEPPGTVGAFVTEARRQTVDREGRTALDPRFDAATTRRWGFYVRTEAYWFVPFLWASGGRLLEPDEGVVHIDAPEAVAALTLYRDLIRKHRVAPPRPSPSNDYEDQMRRFGAGEVAMIVNGPWATSALLASPAFAADPRQLGVAPFPRGADGKPAAPMSGHGYVVSRCAKDPRAAWALARALAQRDAQLQFARKNALLPALASLYDAPAIRRNRFVKGFRRALRASRARPQHPAIARIFDDFNPAVQAAVIGDATPREALAGVARAWRKLLRR